MKISENYSLDSLRETNCCGLTRFLFADTIYNNITLNNPAITQGDVLYSQRNWCARSSLWVYQLIMI
jgi:hypothetical protein